MSTRACIKIKQSFYASEEDYKQGKRTAEYITLYHHSDGYPDGIGSDIVEFLRGRNDGYDDEPMWEAERIATDMVRGEVLTMGYDIKSGQHYVKRDMGYDVAICQHGDCVYGYLIDCDERKVTCYDIEPEQWEWHEQDIVPIPDKYKEKPLRLHEHRISVPYGVGDTIRWERYGKRHKSKVVAIDLYVATDKHGEPYQHAVYRTKAKEDGKVQTWYVNEEDLL